MACLVGCGGDKQQPLVCYVGGTMRPALEDVVKLYEAETGQKIDVDYADSGVLLIKIERTGRGDLYVCHDPFAGGLEQKGLSTRIWTVASLTPTIAVPKGNPKKILGLRDLAQKGIRLGLTDEQYSTLGHIAPLIFDKVGLRKDIEANVVTRSRMGGEIANAVAIGQLDAGIVWDAVIAARRDKLDPVPIERAYHLTPGVDAVTTATFGRIDMGCVRVTIATLKCSKQPEAAKAFAEFANSPKGRAVFAARGFSPAPPGATVGSPDRAGEDTAGQASRGTSAKGPLLLYCGAGIRPPVAEAAEAFQAETGVTVQCDYAGSGLLISKIKATKSGDLFMPGDAEYVDIAAKAGLVASQRDVCYFVPVILVRKDNPKGIKSLADLAKPGIQLGLGDSRACAVGQVSERIFAKNKIPLESIQKNLTFNAVTVNELGLQLKTGHLDAVIVWDAVAAQYAGSADVVAIPPEQNVVSRVPIAVLGCSKQPELAGQFADFLASDRGRAIFRKHHYTTDRPTGSE